MVTRGTILVADDDPDIADVLRWALAEEGYRALVASSVETARDILAAFRVDLVIADAFPPDSSGDRWHSFESDDSEHRIDLSQVVYVSRESSEPKVGF